MESDLLVAVGVWHVIIVLVHKEVADHEVDLGAAGLPCPVNHVLTPAQHTEQQHQQRQSGR